MTPSTVEQLAIVVLLVLPGTTYLFARERLLGVREAEQDTGNRFLRAIGVGVLLDTLYLIAAGPGLVALLRGRGATPLAGLTEQPRAAGLWLLLLIIVAPTLLAWAEARWVRRRRPARHDRTPTAWDALFQNRGPCFVRIRLKNGGWAGGWYGSRSRASAYPQPGDLFLESQYRMKPDGSFGPRIPGTGGLYVKTADIDLLEILEPRARPEEGAADAQPRPR
ncbi:hypothetical protein Acor_44790 [Acrocarpospora corrugata]|uniref:Uncharacterized protein n=1 Tax=Acrocarpospora corrugata TaxID=35763 RepID=A0A5M3W572_9ACTN|nr:DUF6338 family protein [Acrocarpospora corrugata]GES02413.1 hypothetical protein Acor_44790 [Acrocarpospora corrugata]